MGKRYRLREGIIIRRQAMTSGDVIVTMISPDGKWRGIARKGKIVGGNIGRLSLFHDVNLQYYHKENEDLFLITQVTLNGALPNLSDPDIYPFGHFLCELCDKLTVGVHLGEKIYDYLGSGLRGITQHPEPSKVGILFAWKLLSQAGLAPRLSRCVKCGKSYSDHATSEVFSLDVVAGGLQCASCARGERDSSGSVRLNNSTIEELIAIHTQTVRQGLELTLDDLAKHWQILKHYTTYHVAELQSVKAVQALISSQAEAAKKAQAKTAQTNTKESN